MLRADPNPIHCRAPETFWRGARCGRLNTGKPPPAAACVTRANGCGVGADRANDPAGAARRSVREVLGIFYVLWTGCQWSALPKDLPPKSTAHHYFMLWDWDGTLERIHQLYVAVRDREGREASPSAAVSTARAPRERKKGGFARPAGLRHILVDTLGLLLSVIVHPADVQDRDGARELLRPRAVRSPSSRPSSPTAATRGRGWRRPSPRPAAGSWK